MVMDDPIRGGGYVAPASAVPSIPEDATTDEAFDIVSQWFADNFEDAVQEMPRSDGEFYYTHGGPYDTGDILFAVYGDRLSDDERANMVRLLENHGGLWVPSPVRRLPPDDDDTGGFGSSFDDGFAKPRAAHAEMLARIEAVERTLATIDAHHVGMGHNNPPEAIHEPP